MSYLICLVWHNTPWLRGAGLTHNPSYLDLSQYQRRFIGYSLPPTCALVLEIPIHTVCIVLGHGLMALK